MNRIWILSSLTTLLLLSCGKEFLDIKREASQVVPSKIRDYQALLDNNSVMNSSASELVLLGSDEYELKPGYWEIMNPIYYYFKNGYIWSDSMYEGKEVPDWNRAYQRLLYANMVLEIENLKPAEDELVEWNNVRGQALFHRAWTLYQLVQAFGKPYDKASAYTDKGIPMRLEYDLTIAPEIVSVGVVYDRVIDDLKQAVDLLQVHPLINYRASRPAATALLARIYRELDDWEQCLYYANMTLLDKNDLLDYNDFSGTVNYPFNAMNRGIGNKEIIFNVISSASILNANGLAPKYLLDSYQSSDFRKVLFFKQGDRFYGSYGGTGYFTGLAVDEVLLIRAEAYLKLDHIEECIKDIQQLWKHRFEKGIYPVLPTEKGSLQKLLDEERFRELYMRGTRWTDMRKANEKGEKVVTLIRQAAGQTYTLVPNDPKWTWPWPDSELK